MFLLPIATITIQFVFEFFGQLFYRVGSSKQQAGWQKGLFNLL